MKSNKWLLGYFFLGFILAGCIAETSTPAIQPTQTTIVEATAIPSPTNTSSLPAWCRDLKQENGLPASDKVRNSSIVYEAYAFDNENHVINPVLTYRTKKDERCYNILRTLHIIKTSELV